MKTQTLKNRMIILLTLVLSLACTTSAITPQATSTLPTPPIPASPTDSQVTPEQKCAKVIAIQTLNLRATAGGKVIDYLSNGEVVTIADDTLQNWWLIIIDSRAGFARADYLEPAPCKSQEN